jgi:hypothetical protein
MAIFSCMLGTLYTKGLLSVAAVERLDDLGMLFIGMVLMRSCAHLLWLRRLHWQRRPVVEHAAPGEGMTPGVHGGAGGKLDGKSAGRRGGGAGGYNLRRPERRSSKENPHYR